MYNHSRMVRVTRKAKTAKKTIPSIRKGLESFHAFLRTPRTDKELQKKFKELFGKPLSKKHLQSVLAMKPAPQRGGMAPLDYTMGSPDARLSAVPYVQRGWGFANMNSLVEGSPKEYLGSTPQMGGRRTRSRQRGGGIADFAASVTAQPFLSSAPMTSLQAAARLSTGQGGLPSPLAEINPLSIHPPTFIHGGKMV
jgi:hypothetical protein